MKRGFVLSVLVVSCCLLATTLLHAGGRQLKKKVAPEYPELALKMRVEGQVIVEASVDADGTITDVKAISGHLLLQAAALACVKKWQYKAASQKTVEKVGVSFALP